MNLKWNLKSCGRSISSFTAELFVSVISALPSMIPHVKLTLKASIGRFDFLKGVLQYGHVA